MLAWAAAPALIVGCGSDTTGRDEASHTDIGVMEGSAAACGMLRLANEASLEALDGDVGLDRRAAEGIVAYRLGPDQSPGTRDDGHFDSLGELDAVPYLGPVGLTKVHAYAEQSGLTCESLDLQLLLVADWHGQLESVSQQSGAKLGGAAALAAYAQAERVANPNTLIVFAGDSYGASPPIASFFEERPVIEAMNLIGVDADALGNHSFDRGVAHMAALAELADFPTLAANVTHVDDHASCPSLPGQHCVAPHEAVWVGGVRVGLVGLLTPETPELVRPGAMGTVEVTDPVAAAAASRAALAADGAHVYVATAHLGVSTKEGVPEGALADLAAGAPGFDVVLGGHTHLDVVAEHAGSLLVQTASGGLSYARVHLRYDFATQRVVERSAELVAVDANAIAPDPEVEALLAPYRADLAAAFDGPVGIATELFARGSNVERLGEVPIGDLLADSLRARYGVTVAFVNGGGIRAPLPSSYAPQDLSLRRPDPAYAAGPPYDLVIGDVYAVLPFGNVAVTRTVTGAQLWAMFEHSVEALPAPVGFFGQISGLRVRFDSSQPKGSRVLDISLDDGTTVAPDDASYTLATSDFLDAGGDGYTMLAGGDGIPRDKMAEVLSDYIAAQGTITPATEGRLVDESAP